MGEFAFQTLRESITSAIRSKILTGELQPGVKLAERSEEHTSELQSHA